jgi:glycyl-tRNA synthetase
MIRFLHFVFLKISKSDIYLIVLFGKQGELICQLAGSGAPLRGGKKAVAELKAPRKVFEELFLRDKMKDLLIRHSFFDKSFTEYDCFRGQLNFGPMGCVMKNNILEAWKKFFILQEQMLKVECSILTPEPIPK